MPISDEMRRLEAKWASGGGWPKRLEWIRVEGLRGWTGSQRIQFPFPIMAIVGENGAGKSTVLQATASVYKQPSSSGKKSHFASDFFPDTAWDRISDVHIHYQVLEGSRTTDGSIRKPTTRWRGNPSRPERYVEYIDLSRIQPVSSRHGYSKLANGNLTEASADEFDSNSLSRLAEIMGRDYNTARMSLTDADDKRSVLVLDHLGEPYSGFHGGAGETTVSELLEIDLPHTGIVIIDEIESSLHPRSQRRIMRDLANMCRAKEIQIILSTHSPYILDELPSQARAFIMVGPDGERELMYGVSPQFAMTKMDDVPMPECDLYVEDERSKTMLTEILAAKARDLVQRCRIVPYGAASVGKALGQMVDDDRFPVPSRVFLDGDVGEAPGCLNLPGEDAPERVVMGELRHARWRGAPDRTGREFSEFADACDRAMTLSDHHDWVRQAATDLVLGGDTLWQALCAIWAERYLEDERAAGIVEQVRDALSRSRWSRPTAGPTPDTDDRSRVDESASSPSAPDSLSTTERLPLFEQ